MNKEESLSFLQSCIDKVNLATEQDIQFYREMYNKDCAMPIVEADIGESEDKCKNCKYYRNPDYTRCHECEAEREDKE